MEKYLNEKYWLIQKSANENGSVIANLSHVLKLKKCSCLLRDIHEWIWICSKSKWIWHFENILLITNNIRLEYAIIQLMHPIGSSSRF